MTDYANFTVEGINHLYGSPAKRPQKVPSLSQSAAQHKIFRKVERMYVRLQKGDVAFDETSALLLAGLDAPDDSLPPAICLIASAFDIKENCGSVQRYAMCSKRAPENQTQWSGPFVCERSPQNLRPLIGETRRNTPFWWCVNSVHERLT